ncbi:MAG: hypothetical protein O3B95_04610 [Chloroflexi bacterium]|nr:hypothetical protein [Chloroflexota bacterium]
MRTTYARLSATIVTALALLTLSSACYTSEKTDSQQTASGAASQNPAAPVDRSEPPNEPAIGQPAINHKLAATYHIELEFTEEAGRFEFAAVIVGGPDSNEALYCVGAEWVFGDGTVTGSTPGCRPFSDGDAFPRRHKIVHEYAQAGNYQVRFKYGAIYSNEITVIVGSREPAN